ncbi:MAG: helix-hairpin-helix domain-containing protein [Gemmatimonadota bacterium]
MRLAPAEAKAVKFVLLIVALSAVARVLRRPEPATLDAVPGVTTSAIDGGQAAQKAEAARGPIDPNRASLAELDRLPGIGQAMAKRIIAARPLKDLNDLARVIGRKRAQQLVPLVTLRGELDALPTRPPAKRAQPGNQNRSRADARSTDPRNAGDVSARNPVDLNRATRAELERISGIGPALARRLILIRDSIGGFRDWSQIDAVPGVGPALLKKLKESGSL